MIPINSFLWILPLIAPMSVVLSEKTARSVKPRSFAAPGAVSRASASAISGEATNCVSVFYIFLLHAIFMHMSIINLWTGREGPNNFDAANKDLFLISIRSLYHYHTMILIKERHK